MSGEGDTALLAASALGCSYSLFGSSAGPDEKNCVPYSLNHTYHGPGAYLEKTSPCYVSRLQQRESLGR